jgi:membrane protease YdiL (CAAX protease family)
VLSLDAGVTEEAFFRGLLYEELEASLPRRAARATDITLFTLAHVPGQLENRDSGELIAAGLVSRALAALLFEVAYDEGGLPESVALHAIWDTLVFVEAALTNGHPIRGSIVLPGSLSGRSPAWSVAPQLTLSF